MAGQSQLHAVMAGSGNPRAVMSERRKNVLFMLHQGIPNDSIASQLGLSEIELMEDIQVLLDNSLLVREENYYRPNFFIATANEVQRVMAHGEQVGLVLADVLVSQWEALETLYGRLALSKDYPLYEQAMLLVGDHILDVGMLYNMMDDGDLMPSAPFRPAPDRPDAHYHYWMIEGQADHLGKYGQNQMNLLWTDWFLISFGQYWIKGQRNKHRDNLHERAVTLMQDVESPEALATQLGVKLIDPNDSTLWSKGVQPQVRTLIRVYQEQQSAQRELYETLEASAYLSNGFPEFFCWYFHVAYAAAIDVLIERKLMCLPNEGFVSAIWHVE